MVYGLTGLSGAILFGGEGVTVRCWVGPHAFEGPVGLDAQDNSLTWLAGMLLLAGTWWADACVMICPKAWAPHSMLAGFLQGTL